jgi:putative modified peptide
MVRMGDSPLDGDNPADDTQELRKASEMDDPGLEVARRVGEDGRTSTLNGTTTMADTAALNTLLDKLANDDGFRKRLEADPTSALKEIGVAVPPGFHSGPIKLPSKADAQAKQAQWLQNEKTAPTAAMAFFFLK